MLKTLTFIRHNAIALLALFVALGGTSYAAINLPAGSVGTRALHDGAVTNKKLATGSVGARDLDRRSIAGYVRDWAKIGPSGQILASRPKATLAGTWNPGPSGLIGGTIRWSQEVSRSCFAVATAQNFATPTPTVSTNLGTGSGLTSVLILLSADAPVNVAVICP